MNVGRTGGGSGGPLRRVATLAAAAGLTRACLGLLRRTAPGGPGRWTRENHAGRTVGLHAGPAAAAGIALAALSGPGGGAAASAVAVAACCGAYDDTAGAGDPRGGLAHLAALRHGEVTSGTVKLVGIGAAGLALGAVLKQAPLDRLLAGVVVAGGAHLVNLLDVRPGRAALAAVALGAPGLARGGAAGQLAAAATGAALAVLPDDLRERTMLGDTGAHALGAALGAAAAAANGRKGLLLHAAAVTAATAAGRRVSAAARRELPAPFRAVGPAPGGSGSAGPRQHSCG